MNGDTGVVTTVTISTTFVHDEILRPANEPPKTHGMCRACRIHVTMFGRDGRCFCGRMLEAEPGE